MISVFRPRFGTEKAGDNCPSGKNAPLFYVKVLFIYGGVCKISAVVTHDDDTIYDFPLLILKPFGNSMPYLQAFTN